MVDNSLERRLERINKGKVLQFRLPFWADEKRGLPNEILRSALFNARSNRARRDYYKKQPILVVGNGSISYTGEELRQIDEIVFLQIIHLIREHKTEKWVEFKPHAFIKEISWANNGASYKRLEDCLLRLSSNTLSIESNRLGGQVSVSLVRRFEKDARNTRNGRWRVWLEKEIAVLFNTNGHYSFVTWEQRKLLPSGIASKLHGYYSSHSSPYDVKVETLYSLCGSTSVLREFRRKLKLALEELVSAGFLEWYDISPETDLVKVRRCKL